MYAGLERNSHETYWYLTTHVLNSPMMLIIFTENCTYGNRSTVNEIFLVMRNR